MKSIVSFVVFVLIASSTTAPALTLSKEEMIALTEKWKGERYPDGRPKVPEDLLRRMKQVSIEEAWAVLRGEGYTHQFAGEWKMLHENVPMAGRALTAVYLPARPDLNQRVEKLGQEQGRIGSSNSWPIDMLETGDLYVADGYGKINEGTLIGDNLGNAIFAKSGNGVVFDGSVRDIEGLAEIDGFNAFVRGWHPTAIKDMILGGVNVPTRIGEVTVLPGDVVLAKREGVIFIPPHLAEKVVISSEIISLQDQFGHQRLREGKYTPGQIDRRWTEEIKADFWQWYEQKPDKPAVSREEIRKQL